MNNSSEFDVAVIGGGPAGLQAALVLGRARRRVLVIDSGTPRNAPVAAMHGFLSRDGTPPDELRRIARDQLGAYPSVSLLDASVTSVERTQTGFNVTFDSGGACTARRLMLAAGLADDLPPIDGLAERWGRSIFNCPYCDGWEIRDQPVAVIGTDPGALRLVFQLTGWTRDLVLCTNGPATFDRETRQHLANQRIEVRESPIRRLDGPGDSLQRIEFADGTELPRHSAFLHAATRQRTELARQLGCELGDDGLILVNEFGQTNVPGVSAAGDAARRTTQPMGVAQVLQAAAAGGIAALALDIELRSRELGINLMSLGSTPNPTVSATRP